MTKLPVLRGSGGGGGSGPTIQAINLRTDDILEVNIAIAQGPIAGLRFGAQSFYLGSTALVSPAGTDNFKEFELHEYRGSNPATPVKNTLGGTTSNTNVGINLAQSVPVIRTTPGAAQNQIDAIEIRLVLNQLVRTNTNGDQLFNTLSVDIEFREAGTSTWNPFIPNQKTFTFTGRVSGAVKEIVRTVPRIANDWEIRVTKLNPDNDLNNIADVTWESFQTTTTVPRAYDDIAVVRGIARASEQINGLPDFSGVYAGLIVNIPSNYDPVTRYYNGVWDGTFKKGYTDNPAWLLYHLVLDTKYGAKAFFPNLQADRFDFYDAANWCDELVPRPGGGFQPRYTYNDVVQEARNGIDMLKYVAGIFGGQLVEDAAGVIRLLVDKPSTVKQIFGPESITEEGFSYQYTDIEERPNESLVTFVNPELDWEEDVRRITLEPYYTLNGRKSRDFPAVGCIDVYEAQRRAQLMLLTANTEITTVTFRTTRQSMLLEPYDWIGVMDPNMAWGASGRVKSVAGSVITLRDPLVLPVGTNLNMLVQTPSGVQSLTVQSPQATTTTLNITAGSWPANAPDRAQFALESGATGLVKPFRILRIVPEEDNPDVAQITALEININKWGDADGLTSSGTVDYQGNWTATPIPTNIRLTSGNDEVIVHQDGTIENRIRIQWDIFRPTRVDVFYRRLDADNFSKVAAEGTNAYIPNVQVGATYVIELQTYNDKGEPVHRTDTILFTVPQKTTAPPAPTNWIANPGFDVITLSGDPSPDPDFAAFYIYGATAGSDVLTFIGATPSTVFVWRPPSDNAFTRFKVTAVNTSGVEGPATPFIIAGLQQLQIGLEQLDYETQDRIDTAYSISRQVALEISAADMKAEHITKQHYEFVTYVLTELSMLGGGNSAAFQNIVGLNIDPTSAFGKFLTYLGVNTADGTSATVEALGQAVATMGATASAAYVLRAVAGGNSSEFQLVAWDDVTGGGSVIKLNADYIIADGTLSANKLSVGEGNNFLPDSRFLSGLSNIAGSGTGTVSTQTTVSIRAAGLGWSGPTYPVLQMHQNGTSTSGSHSVEFRVKNAVGVLEPGVTCSPGQWISVSAYLSTHRCTADVSVRFFNVGGTEIFTSPPVTVALNPGSSTDPDQWPRFWTMAQAPANTAYATLRITKYGTLSGADSYVMIHKPMLELAHAATTGPSVWDPGTSTYIDGEQIITGTIFGRHIVTGSLAAESIGTGQMSARHINLDQFLDINAQTGGIRSGKQSPLDSTTPGFYIGQSTTGGTNDFGFAVGIVDGSNKIQEITGTPAGGIRAVNLQHYRDLELASNFNLVTNFVMINLPVGSKRLDLEIIGGGAGGNGTGGTAGQSGGATQVWLWDGNTSTGVIWSAPGAVATPGTNGTSRNGGNGQASVYGPGGAGGTYGYGPLINTSTDGSPAPSGSYGAGGGGASDPRGISTIQAGAGGAAANVVSITGYDISALANPRIAVFIGSAGQGGLAGVSPGKNGGAGRQGAVKYRTNGQRLFRADVIPLAPTAQGTFVKPVGGNFYSFPNLGSGFWVVWRWADSSFNMNLGNVTVDAAQSRTVQGNTGMMSFVSEITPYATSIGASETIAYLFYKMGS